MIKRDILAKIQHWVGKDKILIIKGSRQVGKTTLLRQIESGIVARDPDAQVAYLAADDMSNKPFFESTESFVLYLEQYHHFSDKFVYVMVDEFQVIPNAGQFLKNIYDRYHDRLQLIVSGSSSLEITKNAEFLTGRALDFIVDRISFTEFLQYRAHLNTEDLNVDKWAELEAWYRTFSHIIEPAFDTYLTYGGYPEVITTHDVMDKKTILRSIVDTYIEKDIIHFLHIENVDGFNKLIEVLLAQAGNLVNSNELSSTLGLSINTLKKYITILEGTYVFRLLRPFSTNLRIELTKMPKSFALDLGLRNMVTRLWSPAHTHSGASIENMIYLSLLSKVSSPEDIHFYRTISGAEIDFVITHEERMLTLCEVKYRNKISGRSMAMRHMESRYPKRVRQKIMVTQSTLLRDADTLYIPACLFPLVTLW